MNLMDKLTIKKLIINDEYHTLRRLFYMDIKYYMSLLSHSDRKYILKNADLSGDSWIIKELLNYVTKKEKVHIIKSFYKERIYVPYSDTFKLHFDEFLEAALEIKNDSLLYHLASISNKEPEKYSKEIKTIKGYFLDHPDAYNLSLVAALSNYTNTFLLKEVIKNQDYEALVNIARNVVKDDNKYIEEKKIIKSYINNMTINEEFLTIVLLPLFKNDFLEDRILNSDVKFIKYYFEKLKSEEKIKLFSKYLVKIPNIEELKIIIDASKSDTELFNKLIFTVKNEVKDNKLASKYLYAFYQVNSKCELSDLLITSILELKDIKIVSSLMNCIPEIKQVELADAYLVSDNKEIIFILACTTNTTKTYGLIDYIFNTKDSYLIVNLISELKGRFLNYALNKVIKSHGIKAYLKLINTLYLLGLPNFLEAIDYIFKYKLEKLFELETLKRIKLFYTKEKKLELARKKYKI